MYNPSTVIHSRATTRIRNGQSGKTGLHALYICDWQQLFQIMQLRKVSVRSQCFQQYYLASALLKAAATSLKPWHFFPCALLFLIPPRELISEPCLFPQQLVNVPVEFLLPRTSNQLNSTFPKHFDMKQNLATPLKQQQSASVSLLRPRSVRSNHFWEILGNHWYLQIVAFFCIWIIRQSPASSTIRQDCSTEQTTQRTFKPRQCCQWKRLLSLQSTVFIILRAWMCSVNCMHTETIVISFMAGKETII